MQKALTPKEAREIRWRQGNLRFLLHKGQRELDDFVLGLENRQKRRGVVKTTRRYGKTFYNASRAIGKSIRFPGRLTPFVAPTVKSLKTIVKPIFQAILRDCPRDLLPRYKAQDAVYEFPNGSNIILAGTDNGNAEKLRGIKADEALLDEAGFMNDLSYIVNDIITPALMYGDGLLLASSTPPPTADHYFVQMLQDSESDDSSYSRTIWDNPMISVKEIMDFADVLHCSVDWERFHKEHDEMHMFDMEWGKSLLLEKSVPFRREFEAEILTDPEKAIVPEFTADRETAIVTEWPRPPHYHPYTVIDTGFIDFTAVIFGYWDFAKAKAIVEDDILIDFRGEGMNAETLAKRVLEREQELWGRPSYLRFADGDLIVLNELAQHGIPINPVKKDELEAQVSSLRLDVTSDKLRINPRAKNAIAHMRYGIWDNQRRKFARTENSGHFDALAALMYFVRHINRQDNPYPSDWGVTDHFNQVLPSSWEENPDVIKEIFSR